MNDKMELLIFVLNDIEKLDLFLDTLTNRGLKGATILTSVGMAKSIYDSKFSNNVIINSLKILLNNSSEENRTIFTIVNESQKQIFINTVDEIIGSLSKENVGIMFTLPVNSIYGLKD